MIPCLKNLRSTYTVMLVREAEAPAIGTNRSMPSDGPAEAGCKPDIESHISRKEVAPLGMGRLENAPFPANRQERTASEGQQRE